MSITWTDPVAEETVIGAVMTQGLPAYSIASQWITNPAAWLTQGCSGVWCALQSLAVAGDLHDGQSSVSVAGWLGNRPASDIGSSSDGTALEVIGGYARLAEFARMGAMVPSEETLRDAAMRVDLMWRHRRAAREIQKAMSDADSGNATPDRAIATLASMRDLIYQGHTGGAVSLDQVVGESRGPICGSWGIDELDTSVAIRGGLPIILGGSPGSGKTSLAIQAAAATAIEGMRVHFVTLEMTPQQVRDKALACRPDVPLELITVSQGPIEASNVGPVIERAASEGASLVVIDYIQLIARDQNDRSDSDYRKLSAASNGIKSSALKSGIAVLALSQYNADGVKQIRNKMGDVIRQAEPSLQSLKGARTMGEDAGIVMLLWPWEPAAEDDGDDDEANTVKIVGIKCDKNRFGRAHWKKKLRFFAPKCRMTYIRPDTAAKAERAAKVGPHPLRDVKPSAAEDLFAMRDQACS